MEVAAEDSLAGEVAAEEYWAVAAEQSAWVDLMALSAPFEVTVQPAERLDAVPELAQVRFAQRQDNLQLQSMRID